jgi:hypothetical protein
LAIKPYYTIDHGMTISFYYKDPDSNQIELKVNNFKDRETAHGYFQSKAFLENPLGVEIDPDQLVQRWRSGEPTSDLLSFGTRTGC